MTGLPTGIKLDFDMFRILIDNVDPVKIAIELQSGMVLEEDVFLRWRKGDSNARFDVWKPILKYVIDHLTPQEFLNVLFKSGYHSVALQMSRKLCKQIVEPTRTTEAGDSSDVIFYDLKTKAYNNILEPQHIEILLESFNKSRECKGKMKDANKLCYVLCAGIDTIIMSFSKSSLNHPWFRMLESINVYTTNTSVFNIAYKSRLAIASAVKGEIENSKKYLSAALMESLGVPPCSIVTNMYYFAAYIKGCEFEKNPTSTIKKEILKFIDLGLQTLSTQRNDVQEFWTKMFLQRKIYCYLGLSNKAYPISDFEKDSGDLEEARKLIAEIFPLWESMDDRRKQLILVASARDYELQETNPELAIKYLKEAISLDPEERFGDTFFIKQYKSKLKNFVEVFNEIKPCHKKESQTLKRRHIDQKLTIDYTDLHADACKVLKGSGYEEDHLALITTFEMIGFELNIGNKDEHLLRTHFDEDFYRTFLEHRDLIVHCKDVKEFRRILFKFLKQNPLHETDEYFGEFVERCCNCHLSLGLEFMTGLDEKNCWQVILEKIEKESFCGAIEVWGIARLCNIPLSVLSFQQDRKSVQMVSFNFNHDSLTNHVIYVGHVFHKTHEFFPLKKVSAVCVPHVQINSMHTESEAGKHIG